MGGMGVNLIALLFLYNHKPTEAVFEASSFLEMCVHLHVTPRRISSTI